MALEVSVRQKSFGDGQARESVLKDVAFSVDRGEIVALYGPSGIGKTTLLRIIAGLDGDFEGRVALDGVEYRSASSRIGMVVQSDVSFGWLTVRRNISFGLRYAGRQPSSGRHLLKRLAPSREYGAEAERMADLVGLRRQDLNKYPGALSGGMQQRMAFARALVLRPAVLLLDEPFSALDYESRRSLQEVVLRARRELNTAFVSVSHDPEETVRLADVVLSMDGRPATIRRHLRLDPGRTHDPDSLEFVRVRNEVRGWLRGPEHPNGESSTAVME